jgi:site-specific recombinase XerC
MARALTATRARQLMGLPSGDEVLDFRDRAILKAYLYIGIRLATACRLQSTADISLRTFSFTASAAELSILNKSPVNLAALSGIVDT